jgi:hypothetical protein
MTACLRPQPEKLYVRLNRNHASRCLEKLPGSPYKVKILRIYFIFGVVFVNMIEYSWWQVLAQAIQTVPVWNSESVAKSSGGHSGAGYCAG